MNIFQLASHYIAQGVSIDKNDIPNLQKPDLDENSVASILQIVFGIAGAIALIILVYSGLRYVLSVGNPDATAKLRNSIIYALVGLAICTIAFSLVTFVIGSI